MGYRFSPTFVLVVVNVAVYIYTSLLGNNFVLTADSVLATYCQSTYALLYRGWWWQLITSMFVHVSIIHLASNMLFLIIFGMRVEELFKDTEYYLVYFASGFAGNLLSLLYLFYPHIVVSAGASGAIFGLFGAGIIFLRRVVGGSVAGALVFAFMFFVITLSASTNIYAHLGGLIVGLGTGYWLSRKRKAVFTHRVSY